MGPWLRRKDSNLQSPDPESGGLPISRLLNVPRSIKLKELAGSVKLTNELQGLFQALDCAVFAEHRDDLVNTGTDGAARERNPYRLRELAHGDLVLAECGGESMLDRRFTKVAESC